MAQERLGGPVAEVDGKGYAMAAKAGQNEDFIAVVVIAEMGFHSFGD